MDLQLKGKRAFVSGSTKGIGLATAGILAKEGAEVVVNARTQESIDRAISELRQQRIDVSKVSGIACDFSSTDDVQHLIERLGDIDILINNVGEYRMNEFLQITDEDWESIFNLNVMSGVRLTRALLPHMMKQNWGRVIFISSESGLNIPEDAIHYGVTKTALLGLSRGIAETLKGTNVTVNCVLPGPSDTTAIKRMLHVGQSFDEFSKHFFSAARPTSIIQRFINPQEVANLVAYIASPLSSATQGASLRVDGGVVKYI